jgi:transposase
MRYELTDHEWAGRVATRHDKLAANCIAFIQLASIRLWLRVNESTA